MGQPVAIVTGGGAGIGAATVRLLAERGYRVVLNDVSPAWADSTAAQVRDLGGRCDVVLGDVTAAGTAEQILQAARGDLAVLVNNVGDFRPASKDFLHSKPEQWQRLYELNLLHVLQLTHVVLPTLIERGGGSVVNVSTVEAFRGIPAHAAYSAFNAGVVAFTRSLAVEMGPHGVRVNAIAPDLAQTEQTPRDAMLRGRDPSLVETWVPLGRFGDPDDYAQVIAFLASDAARFVTGQTIAVDGGTLAASGWYRRRDGKGWTNLPDHP